MRISKIVLAILFSFSLYSSSAQPWSHTFFNVNSMSTVVYAYDSLDGGVIGGNNSSPYETHLLRIDNAGNVLWSQLMDMDTLQYTMLENIYRLPGGNYMAVASGEDSFFDRYYYLIKYSSTGTLISKKKVLDHFQSNSWGRQFLATDNYYYEVSRNDTQYSYWDNVQMDMFDSGSYRSVVKKFDINDNLIWSYDFEKVWGGYNSVLNNNYPVYMGIEPGYTKLFSDGGIVVTKNYDTLSFPNETAPNSVLERISPSGSLLWSADIHALLGLSSNVRVRVWDIFTTHDSSVVVGVYKTDVTGLVQIDGPEIIKFNASGNIVAQISFPSNQYITHGAELKNGNYIFIASYDDLSTTIHDAHGIAFYDNNLNLLTFNPNPFVEQFLYANCEFIPNQYGGAFCAYRFMDHAFAVNFDSLLNVYPAQFPGDLTLDLNADCQVNTGDVPVAFSPVKITDANNYDFYSFSDNTGHYNADVPLGTYTVSQPVAPNKQVLCPSGGTYSYVFAAPGIYAQSDFYDTYIPNLNDIALSFYPSIFVPGFDSEVHATVTNEGSVLANTTVTITLPADLQYNSSVPTPVSSSGGVLTYDVSGLAPDNTLHIIINTTLDQNTSLGSWLSVNGSAPLNNDLTPANNSDVLSAMVVGSFDPNDKASNRPPVCHPDQDVIYKVRFQNTGTYHAKNVVVVDSISDKLDMSTFKLLSASPIMPEVSWSEGNKLTFTFSDIYLPDSNTNEPASHGDFIYSIRPKTTVNFNDTILNTAHIYFDFNQAVVTNTTMNIIGWPTYVKDVAGKDNLLIYPNPVTDILTIRSEGYESFEVMNTLGQIQSTGTVEQGDAKVSMKALPPGVYTIRVFGAQGTKSQTVQKL